jgi:hypothetical protein
MWNAMGSTIHSATHSAVMTVFLIRTEFLFVMGIVLSEKTKSGGTALPTGSAVTLAAMFSRYFKKIFALF